MRSLALLVVLCVAPAFAQERVFRASSIDIEQDQRLDSLETRVTDLESKPTIAPTQAQRCAGGQSCPEPS
jgi:hypothetical protein